MRRELSCAGVVVVLVGATVGLLAQTPQAPAPRFAGRDGYSSVPPKLTELAMMMVVDRFPFPTAPSQS